MNDKILQVQPTSEMINSINDLNMLRNNLLPVQMESPQSFQQQQQQQNNTLEQYLATIQYLTKQQSVPVQFNRQSNQLNLANLSNLDSLLAQQQQLNQQLLNVQTNSNGNSPQNMTDHDNYANVMNNLPQQLLCLQQRQLIEQQQIEANAIKNQAIQEKKQQELLTKTLTNQLTNQINSHLNSQLNNQMDEQLNNRLNHNSNKFVNYHQPLNQQIIQQQTTEKYTSPLAQIVQLTESKTANIKCLELNPKCEQNKAPTVDAKQSKTQAHLTSAKSANKRIADKSDKNHSDQNNNSSTIALHGAVNSEEQGKPFHNYIGLIAQAILNSKDGKLILSEIYKYILDNYPFYRTRSMGWRNSIRHNLSLNDCFQKGERAANGKGHYWYIHPANLRDFQKGDFRRRRAQRKVRRHLGYNMLDSRLNDDDQDSEDEEMKKQFLSRFNQFQQINFHNLQNLQTNIYHLNNLNNLNPASQNQLNQTYPSIEAFNSSEEYLKYIAFLKRNWVNNSFNQTALINQPFNNLEQMNKTNLSTQQPAPQYPTDNQVTKSSEPIQKQETKDDKKVIVKQETEKPAEDEDSEMVDIESESTANRNSAENPVDDFIMVEVENVSEASGKEVDKNKEIDKLVDSNTEMQIDKPMIDLDLIKKLINNECNYTVTQTKITNNIRKHKFDVDSLLKNEKQKVCN